MAKLGLMARVLFGVLPLTLVAMTAQAPPAAVNAPPDAVQGQSFSVARGNPATATGLHPADILGQGGIPLISCENLGLLCNDPNTGAADDIRGLSFGIDFTPDDLPPMQFSVSATSQGKPGTAVRSEAACSPAQAQADAFETALDGTNLQDLDGDGVACGANSGFGLGLAEGATADNLDALARDPCQSVDLNCDGLPEAPIFLTLAPNSPSLALVGASAADILMTGADFAPLVWAGRNDLGLATGDVIDALCMQENGDGVYAQNDQVLFSLASGSPTLAALSASAADLLRPSPPSVVLVASTLGLATTDDLDAVVCSAAVDIQDTYLPLIHKP